MNVGQLTAFRYVEFGSLDACQRDDRFACLDQWLGCKEQVELDQIGDVRRRNDWLLGRWLAKRLVARTLSMPEGTPKSVAIQTRNTEGRLVRPRVTVAGRAASRSLSISHSRGGGVAAIAPRAGRSVGVDLVSRDGLLGKTALRGFRSLWLTEREREWVGMDSIAAAEAWSVKEAVYKAINRDEPFRPRQFESFRRPTGEWGCRVNGCSLEGLVSIVTTSCGNDQMTLVNATGRLGVSVNHTSQESTKEIEYAIS